MVTSKKRKASSQAPRPGISIEAKIRTTAKEGQTGTETTDLHVEEQTAIESEIRTTTDRIGTTPLYLEKETNALQPCPTTMSPSPATGTQPHTQAAGLNDNDKWKVLSTYDSGFLEYSKCVTISDLVYKKNKIKSDTFKTEFTDTDTGGKASFLVGILLRISPPSQVNLEPGTQYFNNKANGQRLAKRLKTANTGIKKILLFGCLTDTKAQTFVLLEANNTTHNLFFRNRALDKVKVGTCFAVKSPSVIGTLKSGSVVVETARPLEVMDDPPLPTRTLSRSLYQEALRFFVLRGIKIGIRDDDVIVPIQTLCNGTACDRLSSGPKPTKLCGCWNQSSRNDSTCKNTVLKQDFCFKDSDGEIHHVSDFTSLQWSKLLFEDRQILADQAELQNDRVFFELQKTWKKVITHVNQNGGWTIVGWFKRATVQEDDRQENDANLLVDNVKLNISVLTPSTTAGAAIPVTMNLKHDNIRKLCA